MKDKVGMGMTEYKIKSVRQTVTMSMIKSGRDKDKEREYV